MHKTIVPGQSDPVGRICYETKLIDRGLGLRSEYVSKPPPFSVLQSSNLDETTACSGLINLLFERAAVKIRPKYLCHSCSLTIWEQCWVKKTAQIAHQTFKGNV